jgi:hypothetical protein
VYLPYQTLIRVRADDELTTWFMATKRVDLDRRERHLLVSPSGSVAWVALNKTRLTQFGTSLSNDSFKFEGKTIYLNFAAMDPLVKGDSNIELSLRLRRLDDPVEISRCPWKARRSPAIAINSCDHRSHNPGSVTWV